MSAGAISNLIHTQSALKADCYTAGRDELHAWAFRHARRYTVGANTLSLAPPEYVILRKLEYFREGGSEKHLRDIRAMRSASNLPMDQAALQDWIARLKLDSEWQKATA